MPSIIQDKQKIAFLGPEDTYSHKAAKSIFGDNAIYLPKENFDPVIEAVLKDEADMAVIPFFNPYEEHIRECQEKLFETDLIATHVSKINIDLHLASNRLKLNEIKKVYSRDHVFKQCESWLSKNLSGIIREATNSTAAAAEGIKIIPGAAAICSLEACAKNDLDILVKNIENIRNFTLFFVIQKKNSLANNWRDYSLFCFRLDQPTEEAEILDILRDHHLICTQKWTCPHTSGGYLLFFLECSGRYHDLDVVAFETACTGRDFKLIGSLETSITKLLAQI